MDDPPPTPLTGFTDEIQSDSSNTIVLVADITTPSQTAPADVLPIVGEIADAGWATRLREGSCVAQFRARSVDEARDAEIELGEILRRAGWAASMRPQP